MGSGGNAAGSGATPARAVACSCGPQVTEGKPTGAQGRLRPEHRKRRGSSAVPARGNATDSNELTVARADQLVSPVSVRGLWVSAGTLRRRHVYAAEMASYQALSADDFR